MRFMIIVRSAPEAEAGMAIAAFHGQLARAGVLLDAADLQPSRSGWHVRYSADGRRVVDGRCTEAPSLIAGYTLISARSRDEALQWSRRFPNPLGEGREAVIEVRQLCEPDRLPNHPIEVSP